MTDEKILVVDDNTDIRKACVAALKTEGYFVIGAHNGEMAIKMCKNLQYDMVITDYEMGEMNGLDVLKEVKKINPDCDLIMMTSYVSRELATKALRECNASHFIQKPLDIKELRDKVKMCFQKRDLKKNH